MPEMLARYEFKYLIHPQQIPEIRAWAKTWCEPDEYGTDGLYEVNSLYLDTLDWTLARQTQDGMRNRFKARLRTYGWTDADPVFCEIKGRVGTSIVKQRALIERAQVHSLVGDGARPDFGPTALKTNHQRDLIDFCNRVDRLDLRPRLWVGYLREAWGSTYGDGGRLTFDWGLQVQPPAEEHPFVPDPQGWVQVPLEAPVVLELKFNGAFPMWMQRLTWSLGLTRGSCSKYLSGAIETAHLPWASQERGRRWTAF